MKCPKCGKSMSNESTVDMINYIKRKLICKSCKKRAVTYEFLTEDIPGSFILPGTRILIGDNDKDIIPAIYITSCNSIYPHIAIDDDGELQGKRIIAINWGVNEL
jgi:hypothetical protein